MFCNTYDVKKHCCTDVHAISMTRPGKCMDDRRADMVEMVDMSHASKHRGVTPETQREAKRRFIRNEQRLRHLAMMELDEYEPVANPAKK